MKFSNETKNYLIGGFVGAVSTLIAVLSLSKDSPALSHLEKKATIEPGHVLEVKDKSYVFKYDKNGHPVYEEIKRSEGSE